MVGSKKVTLRDVAALAGVSPATVSLVVQGKGNLKDETRKAVIQTIEASGYARKITAQRNSKGARFALVVDDISNPYFHELYEGLDKVLFETGAYALLLSSHDSVSRQRKLLDDLWNSDISGVVLVPATGTTHEDLKVFENRQRPLFMAVRRIGKSPFDYVGASPLVGMQLATEHLISIGHEKIGFVGGYQKNFAYSERYAGFASSLMSHGLTLNPKYIRYGGSSRDFGQLTVVSLLAEKERPSALIAYNDLVAIGIMDAIRAAGLQVGKDIAVIGYDDIPEAAKQLVPLTSVATPASKLGEMVGQALQSWSIDIRDRTNPLDITYPPRLVIRKSCGATQNG